MMSMLRKTLAFFLAVLVLAGLAATAFAASGGPGPADIEATGDEKKIVLPEEGSYLPEYKTMYVNAEKYLSLYAYSEPHEGMQVPRPVVFHSSRVRVLAEQGEYACCQYRTADLADTTAWIPKRFLSADYTGRVEGTPPGEDVKLAEGVSTAWDWGTIPKTNGRYLLLSEPVENCVGFTMDYQVIAEDEKAHKDIMGDRTVYIYNGEDWVKVGSFPYESLGPVHAYIALEEPMTVEAVRTVAECKKPDKFLAREDALDFCVG